MLAYSAAHPTEPVSSGSREARQLGVAAADAAVWWDTFSRRPHVTRRAVRGAGEDNGGVFVPVDLLTSPCTSHWSAPLRVDTITRRF
jgi:hypothetical protein